MAKPDLVSDRQAGSRVPGPLLRLAWLALLAVTLGLLEPGLPANGPQVPVELQGSLLVRVVDDHGAPVTGAQVVLQGWADQRYHQVFQGATDARGRAELQAVPQRGWLIVRAAGWARRALPVELRAKEQNQVEVVLSPGRKFQVDVRAEREDGQLAGLAGATVLLGAPGELPWGAASDGGGVARFDDAPVGPVQVRVFARGFEPYAAESAADLLVRLRAVMALRVHVRYRGQPQAGADVHVAGLSLWPERTVATGAEGFVDVQGLQSGTYSLYAEHAEQVSLRSTTVELLAERGLREVTLELEQGQFVQVSVVSDQEKPIGGARLVFSADGLGERVRHAVSDVQGTARLGPLAAATGFLQASAPGFVERVVPVEGAALTVVLERTGVVRGRVVDERGFPIALAEVDIVGTDSHGMPIFVRPAANEVQSRHFDWAVETERRLVPAGELGVLLGPVPPIPLLPRARGASGPAPVLASFTADDHGRFRIEGVPPGQIVALGRHPGHLDGKSRAVNLLPAGEVEVEIVLGSGSVLRGRVLDDRDFPVADAQVNVTARGFERRVAVLPDGSFELAAAPLDVSLRVTRAERPLRVLLAERLSARDPAKEVRLSLPPPRGTSRILIEDERGDRLALAQVRLTSRDEKTPFEETRFSSDDGEAEFLDVRGLPVRLEVKASGYVDSERNLALGAEQRVRMVRALTVSGRLTTARGRLPAAHAEVVIVVNGVERRTLANDVGEYRLSGLPAGKATLRARHAEHGRAEREVKLEAGVAGRDASLPDLDLLPAVELSGRVVDARGFPAPGAWVSTQPASVYVSRSVGYEDAVHCDAAGNFSTSALLADEVELFAVVPAQAAGYLRVARQGRDRLSELSISLDELDPAPADELGTVLVSLLRSGSRIEISAVARAPLGEKNELRVGDILAEVDGEKPRDLEDARSLLSGEVGSQVLVVIERAGQRQELRLSRAAFLR